MKNLKGEDMTDIQKEFDAAGCEYMEAKRNGVYHGDEYRYYVLMQDVFYIALYQTVEKALDYWEKGLERLEKTAKWVRFPSGHNVYTEVRQSARP